MNAKYPRFRTRLPRKELKDATDLGIRIGILCGAAVLNDVFNATDEDLTEFLQSCGELMTSIAETHDDALKINKALEEMTGISILKVED